MYYLSAYKQHLEIIKATDTILYQRQTEAFTQVPHHSNALHRLLILSAKHHTLLKNIEWSCFLPL